MHLQEITSMTSNIWCLQIYTYINAQHDYVTACVLANCTRKVARKMLQLISRHTTTTILRLFFREHLGQPVPEQNFWTLWCKGRLIEAGTPTIRLDTTPSGLTSAHLHHPPIFYRPEALPATQPTVSNH